MRRIIIMGAGGRDFHNFNVVYRNDPDSHVVAFTAAQIPGIDERRYPRTLAGPGYPDGIPIHPEAELVDLIHLHKVDEVVLAYSDLAHVDVMHKASIVHGRRRRTSRCSGRTPRCSAPGCRSWRCAPPGPAAARARPAARWATLLQEAGLRVALVRHPMPYGDLEAMRVQRFSTLADIDAVQPDHRGARGVRGACPPGPHHVRRRRLRGHPSPRRDGRRRDRLGRRQQRLLRSTGPTCGSPWPTRCAPATS